MMVQAASGTKSLLRAMEVLDAIAASHQGSSPAEIARRVDVPRPTVYRLLGTLESIGMVEKAPDGRWSIGYELVRLARNADLPRTLIARAHTVLEDLVSDTGETAMLAAGDGPFDVKVISQVNAPNLLGTTDWVGRSVAVNASAAAKVLFAELGDVELGRYIDSLSFTRLTAKTIVEPVEFARELEKVAKQGYAETIDELEDGLSGIAAPVRRESKEVVAIVGVYGPSARIAGSARSAIVSSVLAASTRLARDL